MGALRDRLRGARRIEIFAAVALVSALALLGLGGLRTDGPSDRPALETRLEAMLSEIEGAGRVRVMITEADSGEIVGAVVVARELRDMRAYLDVQSAVRTLLDIELSQIRIIAQIGTEGSS